MRRDRSVEGGSTIELVVMIRASRLALMSMIVRTGTRGYYVRGQVQNFEWLVAHGLAEIIDLRMLLHRLTDAGRSELRAHGICDRCGGHGTYLTSDYVTPWVECDHAAKGVPSSLP